MIRIRITSTANEPGELGSNEPRKEGGRDFRGCLVCLGSAVFGALVVVVLANWCGSIGRTAVSALGFGVAGVVVPWHYGSEPRSDNQTRFMIAISIVSGLGGIAYGVYLGLSAKELPLWASGGAGVFVAILGALIGRQIHRAIEPR